MTLIKRMGAIRPRIAPAPAQGASTQYTTIRIGDKRGVRTHPKTKRKRRDPGLLLKKILTRHGGSPARARHLGALLQPSSLTFFGVYDDVLQRAGGPHTPEFLTSYLGRGGARQAFRLMTRMWHGG